PNVGGTNNWRLVSNDSPTNFIQTDTILFDGTASDFTVNIAETVQPALVTVNSATDYLFQGAGKISGTTALIKTGSGALILATDNDYTGGTTISAGTLQLGNGGTTGSIAGSVALNGGALAFNRSDATSFNAPVTIGGDVAINQNGSGAVTF